MNEPIEINETTLETWALLIENKERAKALGMRLIGAVNKKPDELRAMPSLGEFEDKAQEWAIANPGKARLLIMKLLAKFAR